MSDLPPTSFTISETIRTMARHLQEDIRQVLDAETDAVAGIVGGHQIKILEWLDAVEKQIALLNERVDDLERRERAAGE